MEPLAPVDVAQQWRRNGFCVVRVLSPKEAQHLATVADELVNRCNGTPPISAMLQEPRLSALLDHPVVQGAVAAILCPDDRTADLVLETYRMETRAQGSAYRQGWHRDIPLGASWLSRRIATDLLEALATNRWTHNNVQCNLALRHDECFHAIPGSNTRHFTIEEAKHFSAANQAGSNQCNPDAILPGRSVTIEPGEMILQNNVVIHRGWGGLVQGTRGGSVAEDRRTLHFGFHSAARPPTWHFRRGATRSLPQECCRLTAQLTCRKSLCEMDILGLPTSLVLSVGCDSPLTDAFAALSAAERAAVGDGLVRHLERRWARMQEPQFNASEAGAGDEEWRAANLELFFRGGLDLPLGAAARNRL